MVRIGVDSRKQENNLYEKKVKNQFYILRV